MHATEKKTHLYMRLRPKFIIEVRKLGFLATQVGVQNVRPRIGIHADVHLVEIRIGAQDVQIIAR